MQRPDSKNLGNLRLVDGGLARVARSHAERDVELAARELFYAMEGKNKNLRNVAEGRTFPLRMLMRRFKDAKRARRDAVNYAYCKGVVRVLDGYVDALFFARTLATSAQLGDVRAIFSPRRITRPQVTGEHRPAA